MTMFFWARHQIITPCIYWQRGNRGLTLWGRRWLDAEIAHVAWCRSIKDVLYNKWRICSSNHQRAERFQLFSSSRHFVPAFRKNERARATDRGIIIIIIFFFSLLFSSSCLSEPESQLHPSISSSLFIHFSLNTPHHTTITATLIFFFWRKGNWEKKGRDAPININGCGSFPLLSRTIYCLTSATANALLFAPEQWIAMLGRQEHPKTTAALLSKKKQKKRNAKMKTA